jgi:hypothetical protein
VDVTVAGVGQRALNMKFVFACAWEAREVPVSSERRGTTSQQGKWRKWAGLPQGHNRLLCYRRQEANLLGWQSGSAGVCLLPPVEIWHVPSTSAKDEMQSRSLSREMHDHCVSLHPHNKHAFRNIRALRSPEHDLHGDSVLCAY